MMSRKFHVSLLWLLFPLQSVHGLSVPPSFDKLGLSPEALRAVSRNPSWQTPTPIQEMVISKLLKDSRRQIDEPETLWCEAPTGSGKTLAFCLPLLQFLANLQPSDAIPPVRSLILCPSRELAVQISRVVQSLSSHMTSGRRQAGKKSYRTLLVHGGVPMEPQIKALANSVMEPDWSSVDIMIATPGRLADILTYYQEEEQDAADAALEARLLSALDQKRGEGKSASAGWEELSALKLEELTGDSLDDSADGRGLLHTALKGLNYLVLDEADRLLSKAFDQDMKTLLQLLESNKGDDMKTWLFSATFPKHMEPRVDRVLKRLSSGEQPPLRIIAGQSDRKLEVEAAVSSTLAKKLDPSDAVGDSQRRKKAAQIQIGPASTIQFQTIRLRKPDRTQILRRILEANADWDRVLVFVATRYASEHVARKLRRVGIEAAELHGKLDQDARIRRLHAFAAGRIRVLLATDLAARGLDIVGLPVVVNYDLPRSTADFVHRVGRTGRAGRPGTAISFVTPTTEAHLDLIEDRHMSPEHCKSISREFWPGFEVDIDEWAIQKSASTDSVVPGVQHSTQGLAHDKMFGGIKGSRKSKKDRLREKAARAAAVAAAGPSTTTAEAPVAQTATVATITTKEPENDDDKSEVELMSLTVPVLKDMCKAQGLRVGGKKADLVERLVAASTAVAT